MPRASYRVCLVPRHAERSTVIDAGTTDNCRHALHGAYQALRGIPEADAIVRRDGVILCTMETNWRGEIVAIEFIAPRDRTRPDGWSYECCTVQALDPSWKGWPQFAR